MKKLTIIGAGWSGLACAVAATQAGWQVELFEAATEAGGRARSLEQTFAGVPLDNGQHILLGAYRDTLALMRTVGVNPDDVLLRLPLDLRTADGLGFQLPTSVLDGLANFFAYPSTTDSVLPSSSTASTSKKFFTAGLNICTWSPNLRHHVRPHYIFLRFFFKVDHPDLIFRSVRWFCDFLRFLKNFCFQ